MSNPPTYNPLTVEDFHCCDSFHDAMNTAYEGLKAKMEGFRLFNFDKYDVLSGKLPCYISFNQSNLIHLFVEYLTYIYLPKESTIYPIRQLTELQKGNKLHGTDSLDLWEFVVAYIQWKEIPTYFTYPLIRNFWIFVIETFEYEFERSPYYEKLRNSGHVFVRISFNTDTYKTRDHCFFTINHKDGTAKESNNHMTQMNWFLSEFFRMFKPRKPFEPMKPCEPIKSEYRDKIITVSFYMLKHMIPGKPNCYCRAPYDEDEVKIINETLQGFLNFVDDDFKFMYQI